MLIIPAETQFASRPALRAPDSVWQTGEMVGLHKDWLQFVAQKQRARQEYHSYQGGDYRVEGRLAVKMAAAQSAERIAQRAMLHRADQLSRGVGLPEEAEKPSAVSMDSVLQASKQPVAAAPGGSALELVKTSAPPASVPDEVIKKIDAHQVQAHADLSRAQGALDLSTGFDRIFANLPPRVIPRSSAQGRWQRRTRS